MHKTLISEFVGAADRFPGEIRALSPWQVTGQIEALIQEALRASAGRQLLPG